MGTRARSSPGKALMGDPVTGRGRAVVEEGDSRRGRIYFHLGDDSGVRAERVEPSRSRRRT